MNQRYEDIEREDRESQYGQASHRYGDEQYRGRPGYSGPFGRRGGQAYRGPGGGYGGAWEWSDQVWSGQGRFDEGRIGQGRFGYGSEQYAPGGYGRGQYGRSRYDSRYRDGPYGRGVYGEDQYGWTEYDEPRYVGSLYRGERRGEEPYREHEWQRSKERPGLVARLYARGPKGYTRSDERIKEEISERLWRAEHIDSSEVTIAVKDGVVTLTGTVPERWMRHDIEDVADSCMGVKDIENNVRVLRRMTEEADIETSGMRSRPESARSGTTMGAATSTASSTTASRK